MENPSNLVQNFGDLDTTMNDLKNYCRDLMEGREAPEKNEWLQKVKDKEVKVHRLRKTMDIFISGRGFKKDSARNNLNRKVLENLRDVNHLKEEFEDVVVAAVRQETKDRFNSLNQNVEVLSRQMVDLKHIKHQVATREGRDMDGWLGKVEGRERKFDKIRKVFEILRSECCDGSKAVPEIKLKALATLLGKVIKNLNVVKHFIDEGSTSLKLNPVHSNKLEHKIFSHEDLIKFTSKLKEKVGSGGFSKVYKGQLDDGKQVAVKVLTDTVVIGDFMAEMQTMITASHPNLVTLYGFCFDYDMKALVYEFMKNGSLDKILFDNHLNIEWGKLYEISLQTAKGLAYLHSGCSKQIIHRDVKPANVLLDENLSPKITDFGLARLISKDVNHYTITKNQGTPGYMAPEFGNPTANITKDCDVYSFGVMLFEILGKRCNGLFGSNWFPTQVWKKYEEGQLDELIESCGIAKTHKGKAKILSMVALWCVQYTVEIRPSMSIVVEVLEKEISVNTPPFPFKFQTSLDFSMLPSHEVIHSKASAVSFHESLAISNPTVVPAPEVFINGHQEQEKNEEAEKESYDEQAISNISEQVLSEENKTSSETEKLISELATCGPQQFSRSNLVSFTLNFSEEIGRGAFGVVWKGQLPDGVKVAIKVLNDIDISDKTFLDVVMSRAKVNHRNIVKLCGYCIDCHMKALVYEYLENGSLDMILYKNHLHLEWGRLHRIAIETAKALSVLHEAGIIHHRLKASNILLSSNLSPKIESSGLEELMEKGDVSHLPLSRDIETIGYGAPERWISTSEVTSKSDVYSFGMLLFEVLGRRNISNQHGQEWFPAQVWTKIHKGLKDQVMDDCKINEYDRDDALCLSLVALWCAQFDPQKRPSMSTVVNVLDSGRKIVTPPCPFDPRLSAVSPSTSSLPEMSPRFYSEVSPFIELSFQEERSLQARKYFFRAADEVTRDDKFFGTSSQSGGDWDVGRELESMLNTFGGKCPPGGENSVVLYTRTVGLLGRSSECHYVHSILESHQIEIVERDTSANLAYWFELRKLLGSTEVTALFVHGRFIGGVKEVKRLEEEGKLKILLYGIPVKRR